MAYLNTVYIEQKTASSFLVTRAKNRKKEKKAATTRIHHMTSIVDSEDIEQQDIPRPLEHQSGAGLTLAFRTGSNTERMSKQKRTAPAAHVGMWRRHAWDRDDLPTASNRAPFGAARGDPRPRGYHCVYARRKPTLPLGVVYGDRISAAHQAAPPWRASEYTWLHNGRVQRHRPPPRAERCIASCACCSMRKPRRM